MSVQYCSYLGLTGFFVFALFVARAALPPLCQVYGYRAGAFEARVALALPAPCFTHLAVTPACPAPADWQVTAAVRSDVTGDGVDECVLLLWRDWRDWPVQRWSTLPSPIESFHDAGGQSCHVALLDPRDGRELWVGSALPAPLLALAVGDVTGDGRPELVTLEGDYAAGRDAPASHVDVWRWNGFGFTLEYRSPAGRYAQLCLVDGDGDGVLEIVVSG